jgi:hypothetical protein
MKSRFTLTSFDKHNNWFGATQIQRSTIQLSKYIQNEFKRGASKIVYTDAQTGEEITITK